MILSLLIFSIGFYFVTRLQEYLMKFFLISNQKNLILKTFTFIALAIVYFVFINRPFVFWITIFFCWMITNWIAEASKHFVERRLKETALEFIDQCCLSTASGISFRNSLQRVFLHRNDWFALQFRNLAQSLVISNQNLSINLGFMQIFRQELLQIELSGQKVNDQLRNLRRSLKIEINFRRKSRQILRSLYIQSMALSLLYVGFFFFISSQVDLFKYKKICLLSIALFVLGLISIIFSGRRIKWKA